MSNIYVFWKSAADPPAPWTRLTRQGRYIRFTDSVGSHLSLVGAATHNHGNAMSSYGCSQNDIHPFYGNNYSTAMPSHTHSAPSWTISVNNNDPPYYGLDIIYMDFATWESQQCRFPAGAVILSSQALTTSEYLARFTAADGKFILNTTPGATGGNTNTQSHRCQGTTGSAGGATYWVGGGYNDCAQSQAHTHTVDLYSDSKYQGPRQLVTRLYEALALTLLAQVGTVAFCDGTPSANWEIQTGWKDANLMPGNSDPTLSGSDTHTQAISGNSSSATLPGAGASGGSPVVLLLTHSHTISATLSAASHIPQSVLLVPIKLKVDLYPPAPPVSKSGHAQLIGLTW